MRLLLTAVVFVAGLANALIALGFIAMPQGLITGLGLEPQGVFGLSTARADFTAFFGVAGITMLYGAWKRSGEALLVPALLYGIAFGGRVVGLVIDGTYDGFVVPMAGEAVTLAICLVGWRTLPHEPPSSEL